MRKDQKTKFARHLRQAMTDAERSLWHHLRNRALMGCKFRRQHPIGRFIVDFACLEHRLVIELDGGQHGSQLDQRRTLEIQACGYRVLRFWNNDALARQQVVLGMIFEALALPPSHDPEAANP